MPVQLNHTIVHARDPAASARFYAELLGLPAPKTLWHFHVVPLANGVSLDFMRGSGDPQHYAFLVSEGEFDEIFARVQRRGIAYYPGPSLSNPGEINHSFGSRGFYFEDPDGHFLEVLTAPYA